MSLRRSLGRCTNNPLPQLFLRALGKIHSHGHIIIAFIALQDMLTWLALPDIYFCMSGNLSAPVHRAQNVGFPRDIAKDWQRTLSG